MLAQARSEPDIGVEDLDAWFDACGHWRTPLKSSGDPAAFAERAEFWRVVRKCLGKLPPRMAEPFARRTIDQQSADEVCRELAISPANLWALLHRARLRLARCVQKS